MEIENPRNKEKKIAKVLPNWTTQVQLYDVSTNSTLSQSQGTHEKKGGEEKQLF